MFFPGRSLVRRVSCMAAMAVFSISLAGQQAPTYSVNVKVVNTLATVRDKHGKIVNNLSQNDFVLEEDGRQQAIKYFTRETDLPLTLGLLVDTSLSQRAVLDQERKASSSFAGQVVREDKDSAFLIHFDHEVELLQDLTPSRQKLQDALGSLQTPQRDDPQQGGGGGQGGGGQGGGGQGGGGRRSGRGQHMRGGGTLLYDSVFLASDELMSKQQGRKALVILTDGVDRGSKESLDQAIESAQRANTVVYSILFAGQEGSDRGGWQRGGGMGGPMGRGGGRYPGGGGGYPGGGGGYPGGGRGGSRQPEEQHADGKKVLERISKETGGRMFEVSKKQPIEEIYQQIQDELRNQYNLGYTPDRKDDGSGEYHKIHLTTKQSDLVVQARDGYYSTNQQDVAKVK